MSNYYAELKIDEIMDEYKPDPVDLCIYLLEQYALEDGIKGRDVYQDTLGQAWNTLREAYFIKKEKTA